ncbi:MAG: EAL domain-containing protein [Sulfuriferula sp.]
MTTKIFPFRGSQAMGRRFSLIILALIVFVALFSWASWQTEKREAAQRISLLAELSVKSINFYFIHFQHELDGLSRDIVEADGKINLAHAQVLLKRFQVANPDIANANIADLNGQILASAIDIPGQPLSDISQQATYIMARAALLKGQSFYIGRPIFGRVVKEWVATIRYGVRDSKGKLCYILNTPIPLSKLLSLWGGLYLPKHFQMGLLLDNGYLLSLYPSPNTADMEEVYGKIRTGALASLLRRQNFPKQGLAEGYSSVAQANYQFAYFRLANYPITFFVASPITNLLAEWWKHNRAFYILIVIFSLSGYSFFYWTEGRKNRWENEKTQQEGKFRSIYEGSNDAIILLTKESLFDCNQRALEIFGLADKTEFLNCSIAGFFPPFQPDGQDSVLAANANISTALKQGSHRFDWVCRRKNGEEFFAEVLLSVFYFAGNRVLQATIRDITKRKKTEAELHATLEHLQATNDKLDLEKELNQKIIETSPVGIAIYDERGDCIVANPALCQHIGGSLSQILALNYHHITSWKTSGIYDLAQKAVTSSEPLSANVSITSTFGKHVRLGIILCSLHSSGRQHLMFLTTDLTESMHAQQALEESDERFHRVVFEAPIPIMIHTEDGEVLEVNKVWTEITGYSRADIPTTKIWTEKAYGSRAKQAQQKIKRLYNLKKKMDRGEFTILCKDGRTRIWEINVAPAGKLPDGRSYLISTAQDITERKAAQDQVEFLAYHDALTGLPNRLLAKERFEIAVSFADRQNFKVALLFLDLDNFKLINDSLGHGIGDLLLKNVSTRLKECLRDSDTLSRQGGDEFLIILGEVANLEAVSGIAEKILALLLETFSIDDNELSTSLSIGIAVYPEDGNDYDTLLKKADTAMYQSKVAGRNTFRFYAEQMNIDAIEHLQIRNNLRKGMERQEFILHYQPQIDLGSDTVIGAEALIRWNHPEFGMIPPNRFIPLAEESGMIVRLGEWVLKEACRQAVAWRDAGLPELVMAVNLSAVQFKRGDLEKTVIHALTQSGLDPAFLELELTESILIHDTEKVLAMVQRLKALGVKLSIDDFGTGYSSLSYLKRFAVDKLKIDQSFVRDMADDPNDAIIVRTIIQMAKSLNLKTIAEGVETERQLVMLGLQRCDEAQGFYFARPMPAEKFTQYLVSMQHL